MNRIQRHKRIRKKVSGSLGSRLRISVYRSNKHMYAQLIDDENSRTLLGAGTVSLRGVEGTKTDKARELGYMFAKKILDLGDERFKKVVFDRGGYKFHGRVRSFAEALRERGIDF